MTKDGRLRIFSFKRLLVSVVLGVLVLTGYSFGVYLIYRVSGNWPPDFMRIIVGWPLRVWIHFGGRITYESRFTGVLVFVFCNVALYSTIIYLALLALSLVRRQPAVLDTPPPRPEQFHLDQPTSD